MLRSTGSSMASDSSAPCPGTACTARCGSRRRGVTRNSRSSTSPLPSARSRFRRIWRVRENNCRCHVGSSTSTTSRVRTSRAARVCPAIFLPTASGHAAHASSSMLSVPPGSVNPRMSLLARSMFVLVAPFYHALLKSNLLQPRRRRGEFQVHTFHRVSQNLRDRQIPKPFVIRRNQIPGRAFCAALSQHVFKRGSVLVPVLAFFQIRRRKLPVLAFVIQQIGR